MTRHFERLGPMTFNKLRTSYMKYYETPLLEAALKALLEKHILIAIQTSHATKYQIAQNAVDDTETQS